MPGRRKARRTSGRPSCRLAGEGGCGDGHRFKPMSDAAREATKGVQHEEDPADEPEDAEALEETDESHMQEKDMSAEGNSAEE